MTKKKGFTLIELIVVITIIVVVSTIAMISYASTNKRARDSKRVSDLQKIAIALEMARQIGSNYPAAAGGLPVGLVPTYLQIWPTDPKSFSYLYTAPTSYTYTLSAQMEDLGSTNQAGAGNCGAVNTCNYKIISP